MRTIVFESPVKLTTWAEDEEWDVNYEAVQCINDLREQLIKDPDDVMYGSGLARYLDKELIRRVKSVTLDFKYKGGLFLETTCNVAEDLSGEEIEKLKEFILGQYSDGFGEGFEQIDISKGYYHEFESLYAHLWEPGMQLNIVKDIIF